MIVNILNHSNTHKKKFPNFCQITTTSYLKTSGTECTLMSHTDKNSSFRPVAGWNEYVKEHHSIAQDALWLWK